MLKHCAEKSGKPVRNCATIFYQKDTILSTKMQAKRIDFGQKRLQNTRKMGETFPKIVEKFGTVSNLRTEKDCATAKTCPCQTDEK